MCVFSHHFLHIRSPYVLHANTAGHVGAERHTGSSSISPWRISTSRCGVAAFYPLCAGFFMELCCRTKLRYHALAAGCYNSFFGEGEERNHRDCRRRGSAQRFTGEGLCNPMLNSASDLWGSCVKPVCFSCLYFCCAPQKLTIAHGFSAISPSRHDVPGC